MTAHDLRFVSERCPHCAATNRIPAARLLDDPSCGACKQKLFPHQSVEATDASFGREVEESALPVLVDFWAPWCGPCRSVAPVLEAIASERGGRLKVVRVNVDDNPATATRFAIGSIPALKLFRSGRPVAELVGALPRSQLERWLDQHVQA